MRIVRLDVDRFRCIRKGTFFPGKCNVFLGPNNLGKTALLEALNLLLNPEIGGRGAPVDENDFYRRQYLPRPPAAAVPDNQPPDQDGSAQAGAKGSNDQTGDSEPPDTPSPSEPPQAEQTSPRSVNATNDAEPEEGALAESDVDEDTAGEIPTIRIEAVIADIQNEDLSDFSSVLVPWDDAKKEVIENSDEGEDPFANALRSIRVRFEAWYDGEEDDFASASYFVTDPSIPREKSSIFHRGHKRRIGFLIYRDFRALQRPVTLEPINLFSRLLGSQDATPKQFEQVLERLSGATAPLFDEPNFARVVNEYKEELERYLPLAAVGNGRLSFETTDRTRMQVKVAAQLYVEDELALPLQKMGAGTRSIAILAMLMLIARKRGRGILALEEPETFLFPHAQRRVVDEAQSLASQLFLTTHSPHVLERIPVDSFQRLCREKEAILSATSLVSNISGAKALRRRFKQQLSEGLLGRAAVVVEEETMRVWVLRASALVHGQVVEGEKREALEVLGVGVVTADGNLDAPKAAAILSAAGLPTIAFIDRFANDSDFVKALADNPGINFWLHGHTGLEDLLVRELPEALLRRCLVEAPYARNLSDANTVASWDLTTLKTKARDFLQQNKGSIPFHEWVADEVDLATCPKTLLRLVVQAAGMTKMEVVGSCSIWPGP